MEKNHTIIGIHVLNFASQSGAVQKILSEYGCCIRTRLGLHDVAENVCCPKGLILVEFIGSEAKANEMTTQLTALGGIEIQQMVFKH